MILGEHGTGKDVIARSLHAASARCDRPLITVNIGGLSETLFDSELFGHVKGAFTDAKGERIGRFEVADGGTVELSLGHHADGERRWLVRRSGFRQGGLPHQLLVLSEASQALREEEHDAWKRLVRVLSNELNNSLAPISSVAGSLEELAGRIRVRPTGRTISTRVSR